MKVKDVMLEDFDTISLDATIADAARKMRKSDVGALPIREDRHFVGVITDRDITVRAIAENKDPQKTPVREAMSESLLYLYDDQDVDEATELMKKNHVRRLFVLNRDENMVGVVSLLPW